MVRGTASDKDDTTAATDGVDVAAQATESDRLVGNVETTTHGVDDGLRLLENLLLHEVLELALHNLLKLKLKRLDCADVGTTIGLFQAVNVERALVDMGDVVILEVHDLLGVLDDGGGVQGKEELGRHRHAIIGHEGTRLGAVEQRLVGSYAQEAVRRKKTSGGLLDSNILGSSLSRQGLIISVLDIDEIDLHALLSLDTDNEGRTLASSDDLVGVVNALDQKTIGTLELIDDGLGEIGEADSGVLVVKILGELGNALGVGLGFKLETLALKQSLELLIVRDDPVMNDRELPVGIRAVICLVRICALFEGSSSQVARLTGAGGS